MIKIFLTVRNRLEITKKCIQALYKHSHYNFHLHIYNNLTDYRIKDHFEYFCNLYEKGLAQKVVFNTKESTFNSFSKAHACNEFGLSHMLEPNYNKNYDFLLFLDNDIIVYPNWDKYILEAWKFVRKHNMTNIKIIGQLPGGIKHVKKLDSKINGSVAKVGKLGGSGFWAVKPDFFDDVGLLDLKRLVNQNKRHDQEYWKLLDKRTKGQPYILGLNSKLAIHCGNISGSVCNQLTKSKGKTSNIKFSNQETKISKMSFKEFWNGLCGDSTYFYDW